MSVFRVNGGNTLAGEIVCQGAKNSVLPILAATLLCRTPVTLYRCPGLRDVSATLRILEHVGASVGREKDVIHIAGGGLRACDVPDALMREMRSSVILLGALLGRCREAVVSTPGGCELGPRPIDLHLAAFRRMGVEIEEEHGFLRCTAADLHGAEIHLNFPSVGATENIMLLAATAKGRTVIVGAAKEPEIVDLQRFLTACGAKVRGAGTPEIIIDGVERLHGTSFRIMPDRIAAATYLAAAAITGGALTVTDIRPGLLGAVLDVFEQSGCTVTRGEDTVSIEQRGPILPVPLTRTMPYPGFPTDALAPIMAYLCRAEGNSVFFETIFQNRYKHASELARMGAKIRVEGAAAVVEGMPALSGAQVRATDLRGGAALIIAALAAQGESVIENIHLIERGYEHLAPTLAGIGAAITRE